MGSNDSNNPSHPKPFCRVLLIVNKKIQQIAGTFREFGSSVEEPGRQAIGIHEKIVLLLWLRRSVSLRTSDAPCHALGNVSLFQCEASAANTTLNETFCIQLVIV